MSIFSTKILFATDGSRDAELAATTAVGLAMVSGSELHVVTAAEEYPHFEAYWPLAEHSRQLAQAVLDKQVKRIKNLGGTVDQNHLRIGTASQEVVSLAQEIGAGLVVMGSRGRRRIRRLAMGSVSDSVVRHAHCPVMVVRWKLVVFPAKMLLATDGSEEASLAAQIAADLAQSTNSELHVVSVAAEYPYAYEAYYDVGRTEELERTRQEAQKVLEEQKQKVEEVGASVAKSYLRMGAVDEEIVVLAEEKDTDLIVLGSRGLGGIRRALMGSVSDSVVRDSGERTP
ncbi:MAG TPA: universal stress protein [Rubrobacter sp.]|nr:universal stress protein [Rubrobacter sp.]